MSGWVIVQRANSPIYVLRFCNLYRVSSASVRKPQPTCNMSAPGRGPFPCPKPYGDVRAERSHGKVSARSTFKEPIIDTLPLFALSRCIGSGAARSGGRRSSHPLLSVLLRESKAAANCTRPTTRTSCNLPAWISVLAVFFNF